MLWKDAPYWLRGAIVSPPVFLGIWFLTSIELLSPFPFYEFSLIKNIENLFCSTFDCRPIEITLNQFFHELNRKPLYNNIIGFIGGTILILAIIFRYLILGALFGWIYGKLKTKTDELKVQA